MKTRNATILSIGAVLVASVAAIAVNTRIFNGVTALADSSVSTTTSVKASSQRPSPRSETPVTAPAGATSSVYDVPQVGSITLARSDNTLYVTATNVLNGYTAEIDRAQGVMIEVEFKSTDLHYEFRAKVVDGSVVTDVSSHEFPRPGGRRGGPRPSKQPEKTVTAPAGAKSSSYEIPQVGSVTVAQKDGTLYVTAATAVSGYDYELERVQGSKVQVEFRGTSAHYLFTAEFANEKITTTIETHSAPQPGDSRPTKGGKGHDGFKNDQDGLDNHHEMDGEHDDD